MTLLIWLIALLLFGLGSGSSSSTSTAPAITVQAGPANSCSPGQLRPRVQLQGATGSLRGAVKLRNVGKACSLEVVGVRIDSASSGIGVSPPPRPPLELARGGAATLAVVWRNWCDGATTRLVVELGGRGQIVAPLADTPRCDDAGAPSLLDVGRPTPTP